MKEYENKSEKEIARVVAREKSLNDLLGMANLLIIVFIFLAGRYIITDDTISSMIVSICLIMYIGFLFNEKLKHSVALSVAEDVKKR